MYKIEYGILRCIMSYEEDSDINMHSLLIIANT